MTQWFSSSKIKQTNNNTLNPTTTNGSRGLLKIVRILGLTIWWNNLQLFERGLLEVNVLSLFSQINSLVFQFVLFPQIPLFLSHTALVCSSHHLLPSFLLFILPPFSPVLTDLSTLCSCISFLWCLTFSKLQSGNLSLVTTEILEVGKKQFRTCSVTSAYSCKASSLKNKVLQREE